MDNFDHLAVGPSKTVEIMASVTSNVKASPIPALPHIGRKSNILVSERPGCPSVNAGRLRRRKVRQAKTFSLLATEVLSSSIFDTLHCASRVEDLDHIPVIDGPLEVLLFQRTATGAQYSKSQDSGIVHGPSFSGNADRKHVTNEIGPAQVQIARKKVICPSPGTEGTPMGRRLKKVNSGPRCTSRGPEASTNLIYKLQAEWLTCIERPENNGRGDSPSQSRHPSKLKFRESSHIGQWQTKGSDKVSHESSQEAEEARLRLSVNRILLEVALLKQLPHNSIRDIRHSELAPHGYGTAIALEMASSRSTGPPTVPSEMLSWSFPELTDVTRLETAIMPWFTSCKIPNGSLSWFLIELAVEDIRRIWYDMLPLLAAACLIWVAMINHDVAPSMAEAVHPRVEAHLQIPSALSVDLIILNRLVDMIDACHFGFLSLDDNRCRLKVDVSVFLYFIEPCGARPELLAAYYMVQNE
ncbi:uncharacterized protein CLUP02_04744 [Colletotrichum lupini]|uniref:Uncharacterized protein n=1 Tax=Colletotrichum lupini TaxID=145971 RepID=A0A9Q8WE26_9PEZI|nr:uncharacterized protein CLUP02_04744 [Colletotrichum lupini]UQC79265.1 hypothetical protein CLUP02_04744 [Colletotrichum lupini]